MGSITSRPKIPTMQQPQVVYMPAPQSFAPPPASIVNSAAPSSSSASPSQAETTSEQASVETQAAREQNLLSRQRGRLGTVLTGFRGVLSSTIGGDSARKSLLGE